MSPHALLFDLDGTVIHSDPIHILVFADLLAAHGHIVDEAFYAANILGRSNANIFGTLAPDHPDPQAFADQKEAEFRRRLPRPYPSMPGLGALMALARAQGWKTAAVTNAPRANAIAMLDAIELSDQFDTLVIGDECINGKPHPEPYLTAMTRLEVAPEHCIAFEDSPPGVTSAAAAGAYVIGIRSSLSDAPLRAAGAHETITDFTDPILTGILKTKTGVLA
ncbi:HAD family hydrolase [Shimia abyssi]|uniref:HAD superfamily hydrolase (TIGR01509 family) n=1 Tax=Shimia abyssi TaxID=1662395 RepID=A0A2P8F635_9RHOB|nr:HAD-IA family hydrolase [Shimia abyssi]PSL17177.1 HAD superfamily hydrolase (TIGR01509 family) [Shimia abyssi]